jgi:hypothetical protein
LLTHRSLEEKLAAETQRPRPDAAIVQRIKRRKLALKDEMASIERLLDAMSASFDEDQGSVGLHGRDALDSLGDFHPVRGGPASNQGRSAEPLKYQSA